MRTLLVTVLLLFAFMAPATAANAPHDGMVDRQVRPAIRPSVEVRAHRVAREPAPVVAASTSAPRSVWDALAQCESGGRWSYNGGSGYDGGLQFHPQTWTAHGGQQYAPAAYLATRDQQIAIAERVLSSQGWGAWPACSRKLGLR